MDTHKGIDLDLTGKGQTSTSLLGWPIDVAFDSQKFLLKAYPFREDNRRTVIGDLSVLSNKGARFLSGSFFLSCSRDKFWDQSP